MNNIAQVPQWRNPSLDVFANYHPTPGVNPLRTLGFDRSIDKAVSEHLTQSHVSPFSRAQLATEYAKRFYFQFFLGLVTAARLKPGNTVTRVYTREIQDTLQILVLYGKEEAVLQLHAIHTKKLSNPSASSGPSTSLAQLATLLRRAETAEREIDNTISIGVIENHEYELVPQSPPPEGKVTFVLKSLRDVRVRKTDDVSMDPYNSFAEYTREPEFNMLDEGLQSDFDYIWKDAADPHDGTFGPFLNMVLRHAHGRPMPIPELEKQTSIAGFVHGACVSALPDDYYNKILSSAVPSVQYVERKMVLYFPPVSSNPHKHILIDINFQTSNYHFGYDLFDNLGHVNSETKILQIRQGLVPSIRLTRTLQWSIENVLENLNADIVVATSADVELIQRNIEHYSRILNKMLMYKTTRYDMRSVNDLKYFLIGSIRANRDASVGILYTEGVVEKLHIRTSAWPADKSDFMLTFEERPHIDSTVQDFIQNHKIDSILGLNLRYNDGSIKLQLTFTWPASQRGRLTDFQRLSSASLNEALHLTPATTRESLHEQMEAFFRDVKVTVPRSSFLGAYVAGIFQKMQMTVTKFHVTTTTGLCSMRAEYLVDGKRRSIYIEMFKRYSKLAADRALRFRRMAPGNTIIMTYNLQNEKDGLAILATDDEQRHLNTDNVNALCRTTARKKRSFGGCMEKVAEEKDKMSYELMERKTAEKFPNLKVHLAVLHELSGKIQLGFIGRDIIGAFYRKDWNSILQSAFFFGTSLASSKVGSSITAWGVQRAEAGSKVLGSAAKSFGLCLPKLGFDIYMRSQLYEEWKRNDTESAGYTTTYIGLDLVECSLEALEAFGVVSFGSIASPILAFLGASVLVAQNAMQTARRMKEITDILPLTADEKVYEITREFLHLGTDDVIQSMINEITANEVAVVQTLKQYPRFGRYLISAAAKATENDLIFIDDNIIDVTKTHYFNKSRLMPRDDVLGNGVTVFCALDEAMNPGREELTSAVAKTNIDLRYISLGSSMAGEMKLPPYKPYTNPRTDSYCENAFGILNNNTDSCETLYLLFNGTDNVIGYPASENVFLLMNGNKSINGGLKNDHFFIRAEYIYGYLNGSAGEDVVDFSASEAGKDLVIKNGQAFFSPMLNNTNMLNLYHIESIVGRSSLSDYIEVCNETKVDLGGATFGMDRIILTNSCARTTKRNVSITLRKNTFIKCDTLDLVRYIVTNDSETDFVLMAGQHHVQIDSIDFKDVAMNGGKELWTINLANVSLIRIRTVSLSDISFLFKKQNLVMNFDGQNRTLYLQGDNEIFEVIENYAEYIENNLNTKLIAYSQQGTIVLNHNLFMVDFEGKNRLLNVVSNGHKLNVQLVGHSSVENYFLIRWDGSVEDAGDFNVTIHPQTSDSMPCYIDLHDLTKNVHLISHGDYGLFIVPERIADDIKLLISAHNNRDSSIAEEYIGEVNIIGGYRILHQIIVYLHAKNIFSENLRILKLQPTATNLNSSTISILPGQFEFYSNFNFNHSAKNIRPYRIGNSTLLLSNIIPMEEASLNTPLTITLIDYFDFEAKYLSLSLSFIDNILDLRSLADNAEDMRFLWMDVHNSLDDHENE